MCHPGDGHLYVYNDLLKILNIPNPVYGIEAKGLYGNCDPLDSIEKIARNHMNQIITIQEKGPYYLGGSSFGGMVAYEVAQQLLAKGENIRLLYMVDTPGPGHMMQPITSDAQILCKLFFSIFDNQNRLEADLLEREHDIEAQIEFIVESAHSLNQANQIPNGFGAHFVHMARTHVNAMHKYLPKPYPGNLLFFTQRELLEGHAAFPELAWLPLARKGASLFTVPGNHITMNAAPNVDVIARELERYMINLTPVTQ